MAKTFKVGDKVRILDVSKIAGGNAHWSNGDIAEVLDVRERDGGLRLTRVKTGTYNGFGPIVIRGEYAGIELVDAKPTKKQRIKALENEVKALKARIEALENGAIPNNETGCNYIANKMTEALKRHFETEQQTPNQRRKAVIERAKAFVADVEKGALCSTGRNATLGDGNFTYQFYTTKTQYHVDKEKRVVTVLAKGADSGRLIEKAIAKCAPGDVFNEHIGKAIALAKAYGLDCPKEFTDAPQPEPAVGQLMEIAYIGWGGIFGIDTPDNVHFDGEYFALSKNGRGLVDGCGTKTAFAEGSKILDDTEAQYD